MLTVSSEVLDENETAKYNLIMHHIFVAYPGTFPQSCIRELSLLRDRDDIRDMNVMNRFVHAADC